MIKKFLVTLGFLFVSITKLQAGIDVVLFNRMLETDEKPQHAVVIVKTYGTVPGDRTGTEVLLKTQTLGFSKRRIPASGMGYKTSLPDLWTQEESDRFLARARELGILTDPSELASVSFDPFDLQAALHGIVTDAAIISANVYDAYPHINRLEVKAAAQFQGKFVGSESFSLPTYQNEAQIHFCRTEGGDLRIIIHGWAEYDYESVKSNSEVIDASLVSNQQYQGVWLF